MNKTPVDHFYDSRRKFTIIGLTGMAGSGCTSLANTMSDEKFFEKDDVRKPSDIPFDCTTHTSNAFQEEERANIEAIANMSLNGNTRFAIILLKTIMQNTK